MKALVFWGKHIIQSLLQIVMQMVLIRNVEEVTSKIKIIITMEWEDESNVREESWSMIDHEVSLN